MSTLSSYPIRSFSENQFFLVNDPSTSTTARVRGSDLIDYITPNLNVVRTESTTSAAVNEDYKVGSIVQTAGDTSPGDGGAGLFLVVPSGDGDLTMLNGNDLLTIAGDAFLRTQLNDGIVRFDSLSEMESTAGRFDADAGRLVSGTGRDGDFRWNASDLSGTLILSSVTSTSVDSGTDTITSAAHGLGNGEGVILQTSANGLSANTVYWVVNSTTNTFQLSETYNGSPFDLTGSSNFTVDWILDPLQGVYVTPSSDKTGSSGAWARQFSGDVNILWFGAVDDYDPVGNTGTDNTNAIQKAINYAAQNYIWAVYAPAGKYKFSNLYFHYDETNNSGYPSNDDRQGRMIVYGDGKMTAASYANDLWGGTALYSESSTGSASIYAAGTGSTGTRHKGDYSRLKSLSVIVNNSTLAVFFNKCPQNSGLQDIFIHQAGSGGGFLHDSTWFCFWKNVFVGGAGKATSLGRGFQIRNTTLAGGICTISNVAADGFQYPIWLGADDRLSAERMHNVQGHGIQGSNGVVGVHIGGGVQISDITFHAESNDLGFRVVDNARNTTIRVSTAANTKDGEFGSVTAANNYYENVTMHHSILICDGADIIEVFTGSNTENLHLHNNTYDGDGTNTAISLQNARHANLVIEDELYVDIATEVSDLSRVAKYKVKNSFNWLAGQVSEALTEIPFKFSQGSLVGAQPTMLVEQQDGDVAFMEFETPVTPVNSNYNNVNELNGDGAVIGPQAKSAQSGWLFRAMVQVQLNTGDGVETVYMPVYSADPI